MRTPCRHDFVPALFLFMLGVMLSLVGLSPAGAQDACSGFDARHTITRVGGPNALVPGGLQTRADFQAWAAAHADEIRSILSSKGLGGEVADGLLAAIRDGDGITERPLLAGEHLEWMAYRKHGTVLTIDDICLDLRNTEPAFEISVPMVTAAAAAAADCALEVTTECQPGGTSLFRAQAAPGAQVTLEGPGGARTIIDGGDPTWSGPMDTPYSAEHTFTVTNQAAATESVTTHTFLLPRECVNLSYLGKEDEQRAVAPVTCSERIVQPVCPEPPPPTCIIELDRTEVRRGDLVSYQVTGDWAELDLELLRDGVPVSDPALSLASGSFSLTKRGSYALAGTVTNVRGVTASCDAPLEVVGADWIVRPFGALLLVNDEVTVPGIGPVVPAKSASKSCPCTPGTTFGYDDGLALGVSMERLLNERFGLEARALVGRLDDELWIGANGLAVSESGSSDYVDLSLALNVHLIPDTVVDWYLGPFVGYQGVDGHTSHAYQRSLEYAPEDAVTWGVHTAVDWPFATSDWSLHLGARYTQSTDDTVVQRLVRQQGGVSEQEFTLDVNPITFELGVAYHF